MRNLFLALAAILSVWFLWPENRKEGPAPSKDPSAESSAPAALPIQQAESAPPAKRVQLLGSAKARPLTQEAKAEPVERGPARVEVTLSEVAVAAMEHQWNDLALQAEARREPRGWQILRVEKGSIFAVIGLRAGDLVTTDFLERVADEYAGDLSQRFEKILNRITR
jgi:hypothetical protein